MEILRIAGVDVSRLIKRIKHIYEPIWDEKTGRTITCKMIGDIKDRKWRLEVTTKGLSQSDSAMLSGLLESDSYIEVGFIPPNSASDTIVTKTFYGSPITYDLYSYVVANIRYASVGFNLIEQ